MEARLSVSDLGAGIQRIAGGVLEMDRTTDIYLHFTAKAVLQGCDVNRACRFAIQKRVCEPDDLDMDPGKGAGQSRLEFFIRWIIRPEGKYTSRQQLLRQPA